ncbi:ATP-dependent Clp protease proteolytic subunit [Parvibaculum sp.]|jgi:ATP-dependent Clp protease protease subunit|uniref:ATP-dependent Clp protease proteolytic subunit n=1 Tax=Parvibaculum sp. TaxID=2024848 RepID=UPI003C7266D6
MRNDSETPQTDVTKTQLTPLVEQGLFKSRTVLVTGEVDDRLARVVCERLLAMAGENDDPITVIVSSPGGHVESGDMIHDMIKFIKPRVRVLGTGWVASAGALIYVAADLKDRYCLPNTRFLLHEPRGGVRGSATEIDIQAREVLRMRERLNRIFAEATGQPLERIVKDTNRDYWMNAEEAKEYGVVGKIIRSATEIE